MSRTHYLFGHKTEADEISLENATHYFAQDYLDALAVRGYSLYANAP